MEWRVGRSSSPASLSKQGQHWIQTKVVRDLPSSVSKTFEDQDSTTSSGNFYYLVIPTVKNVFFTSSQNIPCFVLWLAFHSSRTSVQSLAPCSWWSSHRSCRAAAGSPQSCLFCSLSPIPSASPQRASVPAFWPPWRPSTVHQQVLLAFLSKV